MEGKQSFVLYNSFYKPTKALSLDQKGMLYDAIFNYQIEGIEPEPDSEIIMAFMFFQNQFELDKAKWETVLEKRTKAGKLGGIAKATNRKQKVANVASAKSDKQKVANLAVNVNENVNEKENVNGTVKEKAEKEKTAKPTSLHSKLQEDWCKRYLAEVGLECDWRAAEGATLKSLITKLRNLAKQQHQKDNNANPVTDEEIELFWQHFMSKMPEWYAEKADLKIINSKFNAIIAEIKKPEREAKKTVDALRDAFNF